MPDYRVIPSIEELQQRPSVRALGERFGRRATTDALRCAAADVRDAIAHGEAPPTASAAIERIEAAASVFLHEQFLPSLTPVINATGVILHTNLGRAPLGQAAVERVSVIASGYCTIEYDVARGTRGRRDVHAEALLRRLTGAESAVVVNNNAAAALLVLAALARGREVIVSRGELVEIGGGFRVPDVMSQSGAILREVGTTNKTRAADYAAVIGEKTALILRVHPSNFRIEGFTERPALGEVVEMGRRFGIPVVEDLGSGHLAEDPAHPLAQHEPSASASVAAGVDVCCFSGDKLLGGPQAGIIVGRTDALQRIRRHPLMRALRVDKMTYAALEATLMEYAADRAGRTIPVQRMLALTADEIRPRAEALRVRIVALEGWTADLVAGSSAVGGGSAPGLELPTWLIALQKRDTTADELERRLRQLTPPIIARIEHDRVVFDLRTVLLEQEADLSRFLEQL